MYALTAVFSRRVREHLRDTPVLLSLESTVRQAVARMVEARASSALVVDAERRPVGIVTEQDVVRRVMQMAADDAPVRRVMSAPVHTIRDDDYLYRAVARMRRLRLRHLPVVDRDRRVVGSIDLHVALAAAGAALFDLVDRVAHEESIAGMEKVKAAQPELAQALLAESLPASEVQRVISDLNLDIHRRIVALMTEEMIADGWSAPPVPFTVIVMGSAGRGESLLRPDQDNGFILADYPDADHAWVDRWFVELASRMTTALDRVGFPLCKGNVMATNPVWRKSRSQWQEQATLWMHRLSGVAILNADICFDFRPAGGEEEYAEALRAHLLRELPAHPRFLREMCAAQEDHTPAVGMMGRLITEADPEGGARRLNLKLRGTLPLVSAVRLLALRGGIADTSTLGRIAALRGQGVLPADEEERLRLAHRFLSDLLLERQIADATRGQRPGNWIVPGALSRPRREQLVDTLRAVAEFQQRVRMELMGATL